METTPTAARFAQLRSGTMPLGAGDGNNQIAPRWSDVGRQLRLRRRAPLSGVFLLQREASPRHRGHLGRRVPRRVRMRAGGFAVEVLGPCLVLARLTS